MDILHQSPKDPAFVQDPYPFYERARHSGELFFWQDYGLICATSYNGVTSLLKDRRLGREIPAEQATLAPDHAANFYKIEANSMLELEPPRHSRLRGHVLRAFTSRRIVALEAEIEHLSRDLISRFPSGEFDLLTHFAKPLPVIIICRLLGVPEERADDLLGWSNAMVAMYQPNRSAEIEAHADAASIAFSAFLTDYIAIKRRAPQDDLISALIEAESHAGTLTTDELISTCILLLNAGHEATVHSMGNGISTLLKLGPREITPNVIDEILRYDPPLHMFTRWAYEDIEIGGHIIERGQQVGCLLAAANRDPAHFTNPTCFDPGRGGPTHTSFGAGIHFCVGAPLARLEMLVSLRVLFEKCPNLRLTDVPRYADVYHFHGLERLMVRL